ncbi:MAG: hypothetical protein AB8B48_15205 [Pseudomonadales bacterium]
MNIDCWVKSAGYSSQRLYGAGRLAAGREDALFALFLASNESDFFVGQSIPFSGGWVQ